MKMLLLLLPASLGWSPALMYRPSTCLHVAAEMTEFSSALPPMPVDFEERLLSLPPHPQPLPSLRSRLEAHLALDPQAILSRPDLVSDSFVYYSPQTGILSKPAYLSLLKRITLSFPTIRTNVDSRHLSPETGTATYTSTIKAPLSLEFDLSVPIYELMPPDEAIVLRTPPVVTSVQFTSTGLLSAVMTGIPAPPTPPKCAPADIQTTISKLETKIGEMKDKLESLRGQESSMGFMKQKMDIEDLELELRVAKDTVLDGVSNVKGLGIGGMAEVCGGELIENCEEVLSSEWVGGRAEGEIRGGISVPSGCMRAGGDWGTFD